MVNYRPIPEPGKRKKPSMAEKAAAAIWANRELAHAFTYWHGDPIGMTAGEFLAFWDWDHIIERDLSCNDHWTNLQPLLPPDHAEKTAKRAPVLAKARRQRKKEEAHRERAAQQKASIAILASQLPQWPELFRPKRKLPGHSFQKGHRPMRSKRNG